MLQLSVTMRHTNAPASELHALAERELQKVQRFFQGPLRADVVFSEERGFKHVEVRLHANGQELIAKEKGESFLQALNQVAEILIRQLRKLKTRRSAR